MFLMAWAMEAAPNPSVIRLHTTMELTDKTICTCPPAEAPPPLDALLRTPGIRSLDLHRYRARLNLVAGAQVAMVWHAAAEVLSEAWGRAADLPPAGPSRTFQLTSEGRPGVAESAQMAGNHPLLRALFELPGVADATVVGRSVIVDKARLYEWEQVEPRIRAAIESGAGNEKLL